jgi:hypothetical protein
MLFLPQSPRPLSASLNGLPKEATMLQDNDPLWKACDAAIKAFEDDTNKHGGLIQSSTIKLMSQLRLQLWRDRQREALARVGVRSDPEARPYI